jgi:hypothetical protein
MAGKHGRRLQEGLGALLAVGQRLRILLFEAPQRLGRQVHDQGHAARVVDAVEQRFLGADFLEDGGWRGVEALDAAPAAGFFLDEGPGFTGDNKFEALSGCREIRQPQRGQIGAGIMGFHGAHSSRSQTVRGGIPAIMAAARVASSSCRILVSIR